MCLVITVAMVILLRYIVSYGVIFPTACFLLQIFPSFLSGNLLVFYIFKHSIQGITATKSLSFHIYAEPKCCLFFF
jgi:hypothetical protein